MQRLGWSVSDYGDLQFDRDEAASSSDHRAKNLTCVANAADKLSTQVEKVLRDGLLPITLGGDHSLGIGTIAGHARVNRDLCVVWVDAHADTNTLDTTLTGHMHGMPVSFVIKEMAGTFAKSPDIVRLFRNTQPCVSAQHFAFVGLRDLDQAEVNILRQLNPSMAVFSMRDVDQLGILEVMSRVLDHINPSLNRPIHVSFDIDAVDEYFAPSTGTSVPGGLTIREALCIGEEIAKTKCLSALDIVEVNPTLGTRRDAMKTVNCAINVALSFLGRNRLSLYARHPSEQFYKVPQQ